VRDPDSSRPPGTDQSDLQGIRVLDLTRLLPGAYATLMLADLGADVIKVEDPRGGDHARQMPPLAAGTSVYFTLLNRNKRSITLNLRAPESAVVLDRIVPVCDVVIDSFRPGTAKRLGVDPEAVRRRNPRAVCASITGFGTTGPYVDRAAHDINYEALAGLLSLSGDAPRVPGLLVGDIGAAFWAASRILAALFLRERGGVPPPIDVSIHEAALQWMVFPSARSLVRGAAADPRQLPIRGEAARYNVYQTADGHWLALGALEAKFWAAFCDRLGRPDLASVPDRPGDEQQRALESVRALMRTKTRDEWLAEFAGVDVCLTPVNALEEALADPHTVARGLVARDDHTTHLVNHGGPAGGIRPAPALGADTDVILDEIGIGPEARATLRAAGAI
jgi:crotonobetainyl-CoA:carnitine CoA-transferase CaiB-like acyl-CoA transferase